MEGLKVNQCISVCIKLGDSWREGLCHSNKQKSELKNYDDDNF